MEYYRRSAPYTHSMYTYTGTSIITSIYIAFAAIFFAASPAIAADTTFTIIPLHSGINTITPLIDGENGVIIKSLRDNGNAHSFHVFQTIIQLSGSGEDSWQTVSLFDKKGNERLVVTDAPHTGEDWITSVQFAHSSAKGKPFYLILATRIQDDKSQSLTNSAPVIISLYRLKARSIDELIGQPHYFFELDKEFRTKRRYCNSEAALNKELGLNLPPSWVIPDNEDGCPN